MSPDKEKEIKTSVMLVVLNALLGFLSVVLVVFMVFVCFFFFLQQALQESRQLKLRKAAIKHTMCLSSMARVEGEAKVEASPLGAVVGTCSRVPCRMFGLRNRQTRRIVGEQ